METFFFLVYKYFIGSHEDMGSDSLRTHTGLVMWTETGRVISHAPDKCYWENMSITATNNVIIR